MTLPSLAPEFSLPDQNGTLHTLKEFSGKWLVLYFYPKDDTPGCTAEACSFRDHFEEFTKHGVAVVGISKDKAISHKKFAEKYKLPFLLLSDESKTTIQAYGAWGKKKFMGREFEGILRNTYLIDPTGTIQKIYEGVKPAEHVKEILAELPHV